MFGLDLSTSLIGIFFLIYFVILECKRHIAIKNIVFQVIVTSVIQCMYVGIYISSIYLDSNLYIYLALILLIVMCITGFIMYKWQIKLIYWLSLNLIISPVLSFALIQLDTSIFDTPFGSTGEGLIPIFSVVCSIILQVSIWLFIKLHKWVSSLKKQEKFPLKQIITTDIKIIGFQVLLSVLLESVFIFYNLVLSSIAIILAIVVISIVRNKLRGHYIFWILSWSGISFLALVASYDFVPYDFSLSYEINQRRWDSGMFALIGLAIYHLLLTIYYKLMEEDQMPEELE
ncbi:hypothetical protein RU87_GL000717 [Lactococcus plantarum]|uniref:Uncharacterized protein n=2 Tax=Pseudolactococcus plantarum TaxID=1365 RepID=A0A2A5S3F6_9LACT|nr:hypothetical protein RU87_GL000717 [Lactococcus plantarum]HCN74564.1 hypothetical protein [Lactococcus sp.]